MLLLLYLVPGRMKRCNLFVHVVVMTCLPHAPRHPFCLGALVREMCLVTTCCVVVTSASVAIGGGILWSTE